MAYYDPATGRMLTGQMVGGGTGASNDTIALAVAEAVGRCRNKTYKASPLAELKKLFQEFPQLKRDGWAVGQHPVSPLIELYVKETMG